MERMNPDPTKFRMSVAPGVKNAAQVDEMGADAPDIEVPFCIAHGKWPCMECGTKHFEGCECPYCMEPKDDGLDAVREAAGYAASMLRGMEVHWRLADVRVAKELARYSQLLQKFAQGGL